MAAVSSTDRLVVPSGVVPRRVEARLVLLNAQTGRSFALDEIGARVWALIEGAERAGEVYAALLDEFDVDATTLKREVDALIGRLEAEGLLEVCRE